MSSLKKHHRQDDSRRPRGVQHDLPTRRTVFCQALGVAVLALVGMSPAIWEIGEHLFADRSPGLATWAYLVLWLGLVQLAYAVYLAQLPDWSSLWVVAHACLLIAAIYGVGLGIGLSAGGESWIIVVLGLADRHHAGQLTGWCLILTSVSLLAAYLLGRYSLRWHRRYMRTFARTQTSPGPGEPA
jgi:hypothetical protein